MPEEITWLDEFESAVYDWGKAAGWDGDAMDILELENEAIRIKSRALEVKVLVYNSTYHIMVNGKDVYWRKGIGLEYHDKTVAIFNSMAVIIVQAMEAIGLNPTLVTWQ